MQTVASKQGFEFQAMPQVQGFNAFRISFQHFGTTIPNL